MPASRLRRQSVIYCAKEGFCEQLPPEVRQLLRKAARVPEPKLLCLGSLLCCAVGQQVRPAGLIVRLCGVSLSFWGGCALAGPFPPARPQGPGRVCLRDRDRGVVLRPGGRSGRWPPVAGTAHQPQGARATLALRRRPGPLAAAPSRLTSGPRPDQHPRAGLRCPWPVHLMPDCRTKAPIPVHL